MTYSPQLFHPLTFFDVTPRFHDGSDTAQTYLVHGYILQDAIYLGGPHPDDCRCPGSR